MSLELTINENLKKAMLAKDEKGLRALRAIKAAILSTHGGTIISAYNKTFHTTIRSTIYTTD